MYIPVHFKLNDIAEIRTFVMSHPFGALLTNGRQVPQVTHLPMQLLTDDVGNDLINLHLSKATHMLRHSRTDKTQLQFF